MLRSEYNLGLYQACMHMAMEHLVSRVACYVQGLTHVVLLLYQICGIEWPESILRVVCNARAPSQQRVALLSHTDPCLKPAVKGELYGSGANGRLEPDPL